MEIELPLLSLRSPAIIAEYFGPKYIAESIIGIKLKLITKSAVFIDKNLDKIIKILKNIADKIIFFVFVIVNLFIIKSPLIKFWSFHG